MIRRHLTILGAIRRHLTLFDVWHGAILGILAVFYVAVSSL